MNIKKILLLSSACLGIGFSIGYGLVYAKIIPGVDRPYNPGAYYSQTEVSYADSPSTFALRDLAKQGGSVYDYKRHQESIPSLDDFINVLQTYVEKTLLKEKNTTPLSSNSLNMVSRSINIKQDDVISIYKENTAKVIEESKAFRSSDDYSQRTYDTRQQSKIIEDQYRKIAQEIQKLNNQSSQEAAALESIINNAQSADGRLETEQLIVQINALQEAENARKTALMAKLIQIQNMEQRINRDENIKGNREAEHNRIHIVDPYNPEEYTRPESIGFQNFE